MIRSTRIGALKAAVKRLEAAAGKGERCACCRLSQRRSWPDPKRPRPEDVIKTKCEFCRLEHTVSLDEMSEEWRDIIRLRYSFTAEDRYTNPKAHALAQWFLIRAKQGRARLGRPAARKDHPDPRSRALAKLREEAVRLFRQRKKRLDAKYGAHPFPEQEQLIRSLREGGRNKRKPRVYVEGLFELEEEETDHFVCAEMEKIIWGETRPATASAIEITGRRIDELIRAAEEKAERREEEARLRTLEFLDRKRAQAELPPSTDEHVKTIDNVIGLTELNKILS